VLIAGLPAAGAGQSLRTLATIPTPNLMRLLDQQTGGQAGQPGNQGVRVVWDDSPSLRFGSAARLDFRFRLQEDVRKPGDAPLGFETWQLKRLRGGIDGELFDRVQFQLERELYEQTDLDQDDEGYSETLWKDVFVDVNIVDALQVRAGRFKIPFGGEQLTGTTNLDFAFRTLGATYLSPSRDTGVAVHGDIGAVNYWIGGFEHDGDNSRSRRIVGGDEAIAGRVTVQAWNQNNGPGILEISGAFMRSTVSDESVLPNGLRARTVLSKYDFYEEVFVKGQRIRLQGDVDFMGGPFSARAEYTWVTDERLEQGFGSDALPEARARAWYASGSWVITGERKDRPVEPRHWLGAVEVAGRLERIRFGSVTGVDTPFRNPRAETIYPVANRVATIGVNWYITRWGKIQLNAIREQIDDVERSPVLNGAAFWSRIVRFQLAI
jgi:phosphate-selective porin OprO/OprP